MNDVLIAVPIVGDTIEEMVRRVPEAEAVADVIEFRLDTLETFDIDHAAEAVIKLLSPTTHPVILTCRPWLSWWSIGPGSFEDRVRFWQLLFPLKRPDLYFDLEQDLVHWFQKTHEPAPWEHIIASYHNFTETPADVFDIYDSLAGTRAGILKIATQAHTTEDALKIFRLFRRAKQHHRKFIGIGIGPAGVITRVLGPLYGSFLTFAALTPDEQTAAGQTLASELRDLYRLHELGPRPKVMGIIGNPVTHSLSPLIHNTAFKQRGLDAVYVPVPVDDVGPFFRDFVDPRTRSMDWDLRGLSVTIPHKPAVLPFLDQIDSTAEGVGAANTIVIEGERLIGYNTDVEGVLRPLKERTELNGARVVIIGAGGAARAACYGLRREGANVTVVARHPDKARPLAEAFGCEIQPLDDIDSIQWDVLIQATPVGMSGHSAEGLVPPPRFVKGRIVFEMVYNPPRTRLLEDAQAAGCETIWGGEMLVHQAARQFELWTGQPAPVEAMMTALTAAGPTC